MLHCARRTQAVLWRPRAAVRLVAAQVSTGGAPSPVPPTPLVPLSFKGPNGGAPVPGFAGGARGSPAVIVIQEWWGVTDQVKRTAARLAKEGSFRVLVPDIYKGKIGVDAEEASHLMGTLDFPNAVAEIAAAAAHLKAEGSPTVGVVGFCMGGALAMGGLAASGDLTCGAPFYGVNFGLFTPQQLKDKAVQGHFGRLDAMAGFSDPATAAKLEEVLTAAGNDKARVFLYDGVGHAFMNDDPAPFATFDARAAALGFPPHDPAQAKLAWARLLSFLGHHLRLPSLLEAKAAAKKAEKAKKAKKATSAESGASAASTKPRQAKARPLKSYRCSNCGARGGHFLADCPVPAGNTACHICGQEGHKSRACPTTKLAQPSGE